jgi:hypothetical protein
MEDIFMINEIKLFITLVAGIIAGGWAFYKFYYREKNIKKDKTGHLILKSDMEEIGNKESFKVVKFSLNIINKSKNKMYVLADYVNIYGISTVARQMTEKEYINMSMKKIEKKRYAFLHRFVKLKEKTVVFSGKIFDYDDYWWLERQEKLQIDRIVYIPDSFEYAEMIATVYYSINKDWLSVTTISLENEQGLCHEVLINTEKYKGEKFNWHNKDHLKLHDKYRNAEINNSSLLFIK